MPNTHSVIEAVGIISIAGTLLGHAVLGLGNLFGWSGVSNVGHRMIALGTDVKKACFPPKKAKNEAVDPPSVI